MSSSALLPSRPWPASVRRIAWQAPLALILGALAVMGVGGRFELVGCLYLALVTPELARVDFAEHRLPNVLVLPGFAFAALGAVFGWLATGHPPLAALVALIVVGAFFALLSIAGGIGMGDVKLAAVLALAGGAVSSMIVLGTLVVGFVGAGLVALITIAAGGGRGSIAFGPYLLGGFWASVAALPLFA